MADFSPHLVLTFLCRGTTCPRNPDFMKSKISFFLVCAEFRIVGMMWFVGHPLTVFSSFSKASRASSYVQISSRHSRWMLPCFISSSKKLALRSRRSTEWAASAGRNTETKAVGGRTGGEKKRAEWGMLNWETCETRKCMNWDKRGKQE